MPPATRLRYPVPVRLAWLWALSLCVIGCDGGATSLVVQVRTDLRPQLDFEEVVVEAGPCGAALTDSLTVSATDAREWGAGVRVAEIGAIVETAYCLRVAAVDADDGIVVERPVRLELSGGIRVVTVLLTRDCTGVSCPLAGDAPSLTACVGGRCDQEGCSEDELGMCAAPDCTIDPDCPPPPAECAAAECTGSGTCFERLDHTRCAADEVCDGDAGCVSTLPVSTGPVYSLEVGMVSVDEAGFRQPIRVHLTTPMPLAARASVSLVDLGSGSAMSPEDYSFSGGTVMSPVGAESGDSPAFDVTITDDMVSEGNEDVVLELMGAVGATIDPARARVRITILDDDGP